MIFGLIATATKHEHWMKTPEEVEPIVGPFCRMIESLPKSALKSIEKNWNPIALAGGIAFTVVPDTVHEVQLRRLEREDLGEEKSDRTIRPDNKKRQAALRNNGHGGRNEARPQDVNADWRATLPPEDMQSNYRLPD